MKNFLFIIVLTVTRFISSQTTIFSENFGNPSSNISVNSYTGWQNTSPIIYNGNSEVRNTQSSNNSGASGGGNIFFTNTLPRTFTISGINTSTYSGVMMYLNHFKSTTLSSNELLIEVSSDGINFTSLSYTRPTGSGTATWSKIQPIGNIPITSNLRVRFTLTTTSAYFRIDDVIIIGSTPLPVELTYFEGFNRDGVNVLKWQTVSEYNTNYFVVEKTTSGDFLNPIIVGNVLCSIFSQEVINYDILDMKPDNSINYYRLVQYDRDGNFEIFGPISIDNRRHKEVEKIVNLLGVVVDESYKGVVIILFKNGEFLKTYQF